ncbi:MAG: class I SAM-dependent methyltransferase [Terracidiphilus sp.]
MNKATLSEANLTAPRPAANFDSLAHVYRWMELFTFGPYLARCRTAYLPDCASRRRALILGDGDGRFTAELLRTNPTIEVDAVDASPAMLKALLRRVAHNRGRVRVRCADIRDWQPPDPSSNLRYDLIVTHFFLDCLRTEEVRSLAATLRTATADDAIWIVSEFSIPEHGPGRWAAAALVSFLYRAFGLLTGLSVRTLPDHASALGDAGFALKRRRTRLHNLLISEIWSPSAADGPKA